MGSKNKIIFTMFGLFSVFLISDIVINAQQPKWFFSLKTIEILKSGRQDVEKKFEKAEIKQEDSLPFYSVIKYKTEDGYLEVYYSNGLCNENKDSIWNVSKNTVLSIRFEPNKSVKPSILQIKLNDFQQEKSYDTPNIIYSNQDLGIKIDVYENKIRFIEFHTNSEQNKKFSCLN